jgi:hypothetical protein
VPLKLQSWFSLAQTTQVGVVVTVGVTDMTGTTG